MKKLLYLFFIISSVSYAQEKGNVFLSVFPENAIIKLKDSTLKSQQTYSLDTGSYLIKMWMPQREYVERKIDIKSAQTIRLHEVLSYSEDYKKHLRKKRMYAIEIILTRYVPPILLGYSIYSTIKSNKAVSNELDLTNESKTKYENEFNQSLLTTYKSDYYYHKELYEDNVKKYNNNLIYTGVIFTSAAVLQYLSYKLKKPQYEEKILLSSFFLNNYGNKLIPSISLTYNIR